MPLRITLSVCSLAAAGMLSIPAQADTITISYSLVGGLLGPPVISGTTLAFDGFATGSVTQWNSAVNSAWNPVTFQNHNVADLRTGLASGRFSIAFANGDTLFGSLFEDASDIIASGGGTTEQTLTFSGGTGEFVGATGMASGPVAVGPGGVTASGSGTLTAPGVFAPEPGTLTLLSAGLTVLAMRRKLLRRAGRVKTQG